MDETQARLRERLAQVVTDLQSFAERCAVLEDEEKQLQRQLDALTSVWPKQATLYASPSEEAVWHAGLGFQLDLEALQRFEHAEAYKLTVEVTQEDRVTVVACNDIPLARACQSAPTQGA